MSIIRAGRAAVFALAASLLATAAAADGAALPKPTGEVVLRITGDIGQTNEEGAAAFDMAMLQALPATSFDTSTIWSSGTSRFTGVLLKDLLAAVEARGSRIKAVALNDYAVEIPVADAVEDGPVVAYLLDGKPMSVRDKGPLWVVYPFDAKADYRSETIYSRSIWQLTAMEILP